MAVDHTVSGNLNPASTITSVSQITTFSIEELVQLAEGVSINFDNLSNTNGENYATDPKMFQWNVPIAAAIAMAESSGNPRAVNQSSNATGLWQITPINWGSNSQADLENPDTNGKVALEVYKSQGWKAWATYRSGAYLAYLPAAKRAAGSKAAGVSGPTTGVTGTLDNAGSTVQGAVNTVGGFLGKLSADLFSGQWWLTVGKILLGLIFLVLGAYLLIKE